MSELPRGLVPPVPGDAVASTLARLESKLDAMAVDLAFVKRHLTVHTPEPNPDYLMCPVFDSFGVDIGDWGDYRGGNYPLHSTCRCGRQIMLTGPGTPWQHCD